MEEAVLNGRYEGLEAVRGYYVDFFKSFYRANLEAMRKIYPEVETDPTQNVPFGFQLLHTLTTPIIEVAEDRDTAKAVWISPGIVTAPAGGKLQAFLALGPLRRRLHPRRRRLEDMALMGRQRLQHAVRP